MCTYNLTCRIQTKHDEDGALRSLHSNRSQNLVMVVGTSAIQLQSTVLLKGEEGLIDWTFYGRSSTLFHQKVRIDTGFGAHGASRIHQGQVTAFLLLPDLGLSQYCSASQPCGLLGI